MDTEKLDQIEDNELLWKEYKLHIELFNSYLTTCLLINVFYYAFAGGLLSVYFNSNKSKFIFSLICLFLLGVFLLCVFYETKSKIGIYGDYIIYLAKKLDFRFVHIKPKTLVHTANNVTYMMLGNLLCLFILFIVAVYA